MTTTAFIRATPDEVWQALTDPDQTAKYFFGTRVESTFEPGAPYVSAAGGAPMVEGEILAAEPPRLLQQTWRTLWAPEAAAEEPSRVTWEIEAQEDGTTKLTVVHDQLENAPVTAASVEGGWSYVVSGLKTLLETGAPLAAA
jgi:uncharacterized protein YndB with AHSA1/START domain